MWLFSELEGETGIDENILYQKAIDDGIEIFSVYSQPGNKFMGFGVSDSVGDAIINQSSLEDN